MTPAQTGTTSAATADDIMPVDSSQNSLRALRDDIKRVIDYRSFYLRYCPNAYHAGGRLQTLCPIPTHDHSGTGHPSLSIDLTRGLFHCFSRDEGGDAITFYQLMHNVAFGRAVREMARELGVSAKRGPRSLALRAAPDPPDETAPDSESLARDHVAAICETFLQTCRAEDQTEGINYLARRGIDVRTIRRAGLAYFPRRAYRRIMRRMLDAFPLADLQRSGLFNAREHLTFYRHRLLFPFRIAGRAIYLQARTTAAGVEPRWHNMRGGVPSLYNADALDGLPSGRIVYLVEGFTDTLTLLAHGFAAVGLVGAGGFKPEWLAPLARFRIVSALDPDTAGQRAAAAYAELFATRGLSLARITLAADINDFFRHHPTAAVELELLTEAAFEKCP